MIDLDAGFDCLDFAHVATEKKEGPESAIPVSGHGGSDLGVRHSSSPVYVGHSHGHGVSLDQQFFLEEALGAYHVVAQGNIDEFTTNADLFEVFDHAILECGSQAPSTGPLLQPPSSSAAVDEESFGSNQSPTKCESKSDISSNTQDSKDGEVHTTPHEKDSLFFPTQETLYCTYGEEATITTLPQSSIPHDSTLSSLEDFIHSYRDDRSDGIGSLGFDGRPLPPISVAYPYPSTTSPISPVSTSCIFQPSYSCIRPPLPAYHTPYSFDTRGTYQPIVTFDDRHRDVNSLCFNSRNPRIPPTNPNERFTYNFQHAPPQRMAFSPPHRLALNDRSQRMTPNDNLLGETLPFPLMHNFANNMGSYQPIRPTSVSRAPYFVQSSTSTQPQTMVSQGTRNVQDPDLPSAANTLEYQDQSPLSQGCPGTSEPICRTSDAFEENAPKVRQIGTYPPEQRLERITRYRQKRAQRNFVKTIKYACRKTLADSRPRIRGRFAKNQDTSGTFGKCSNKFNDDDDDEEDLLYDEEDEGRT